MWVKQVHVCIFPSLSLTHWIRYAVGQRVYCTRRIATISRSGLEMQTRNKFKLRSRNVQRAPTHCPDSDSQPIWISSKAKCNFESQLVRCVFLSGFWLCNGFGVGALECNYALIANLFFFCDRHALFFLPSITFQLRHASTCCALKKAQKKLLRKKNTAKIVSLTNAIELDLWACNKVFQNPNFAMLVAGWKTLSTSGGGRSVACHSDFGINKLSSCEKRGYTISIEAADRLNNRGSILNAFIWNWNLIKRVRVAARCTAGAVFFLWGATKAWERKSVFMKMPTE